MIQTRLTKFVSETRDMWRYLAASSILCFVTLLCIVCTGPAQSTHRQLGHDEIEALHLICMTYVKSRDETDFDAFKALCRQSQTDDLHWARGKLALAKQHFNADKILEKIKFCKTTGAA